MMHPKEIEQLQRAAAAARNHFSQCSGAVIAAGVRLKASRTALAESVTAFQHIARPQQVDGFREAARRSHEERIKGSPGKRLQMARTQQFARTRFRVYHSPNDGSIKPIINGRSRGGRDLADLQGEQLRTTGERWPAVSRAAPPKRPGDID